MLHRGMLKGELRRSRPKVQRTRCKAGCECFARLRANPRIPLGLSVRLLRLASLEKQCTSNIPRVRLQSFSSGRYAGPSQDGPRLINSNEFTSCNGTLRRADLTPCAVATLQHHVNTWHFCDLVFFKLGPT